jgi:hypothetical protein
MNAMHRIRIAAEQSGWVLRSRKGDRHGYANGGTYDRDIFVMGEVHRKLAISR